MLYAIALGFDRVSTEKIKQKIIEIAESNINPYMYTNKIPPHLTISLFETDNEINLRKAYDEICLKVTKNRIQVNSIEIFKPEVIYYAPNKSDYLTHLNKMTTDKLFEIGIEPDKYYLPTIWVPHIALGVQLTHDELIRSSEIVKKDFKPFISSIEKVVLAKCNPYDEIAEYLL